MRALIVYYSLTGNTEKVAGYLEEVLKEKQNIEVETERLEVLDEPESFKNRAIRALLRKQAKIKGTIFDGTAYGIVCLGTPVWVFAPAPAMNAYLSRCSGLEGKEAIIFETYDSGLGKDCCLNRMEKVLRKKGIRGIIRFAVSQNKVADGEKVKAFIEDVLESGFRRVEDAGIAGSGND